MKIALFPGSFDPITKGHQDIVNRISPLFDKIVIGIGVNSSKKYLFSLEQRMNWIKETFSQNPKVTVQSYSGLTIDFCNEIGAQHIIRGIRNVSDYTYESTIAQMNLSMENNIETLFLQTTPSLSAINSSIVRDIIINKGNASQFIPDNIKSDFEK